MQQTSYVAHAFNLAIVTLAVSLASCSSPRSDRESSDSANFLRIEAENGDAQAQIRLAHLYMTGSGGVKKDEVEGIAWLKKSAEQGNTKAQLQLGWYLSFLGMFSESAVKRDSKQAAYWYRRAADQGDAHGQFVLAGMYFDGVGVEQNYRQAFSLFYTSATQGHADAQSRLASLYREGHGVNRDDREAANWYQKAAAQEHTEAQYQLGLMYAEGRGVERNDVNALQLVRLVAEKSPDNIGAVNFVAKSYHEGTGVPQDYVQARAWYQKAAEQGNSFAMSRLAAMNMAAEGSAQDYVEAHKWLNIGASLSEDTDERKVLAEVRDGIAKDMTFAQVAAAQKLATEWFVTHEKLTSERMQEAERRWERLKSRLSPEELRNLERRSQPR